MIPKKPRPPTAQPMIKGQLTVALVEDEAKTVGLIMVLFVLFETTILS